VDARNRRLYIMSYFNPMPDEQGWVNGWANWLKTTYNFAPAQVTVGLDGAANAYDVNAFAAWAAAQGYSTSYWEYDPAQAAASNAATSGIYNAYHAVKK